MTFMVTSNDSNWNCEPEFERLPRKQEEQERKREEEKRRREAILEQYRQRKLREELEKEGALLPKETVGRFSSKSRSRRESKPRPRSAYIHMNSDLSSLLSLDNAANKRNSQILTSRDVQDFDLDSLNSASTSASSHDRNRSPSNCFPPHRNTNLQIPEGSGPSSDGASDTASNGSSAAAGDYTGPKLFVKPAAKSNRGIIINAINTVLAGAVNEETKRKVLEEIIRSESKHFLILFRDAGCQFRALYTYNPEREEVTKLYGIGPKNVTNKMMERFYKYNSGGKCFSEIQTKHLTVTIDAFTIPNSLWAGKKLIPPRKEFL
ncbi:Patronin [Araneus ventricosus]|uniref:Patronin n=1 Tax=Araneus ventricosus TaxID=182803 RepID=A0A4Y2TA81_ARAVE|nr:Patronin [Araneus ventricosus]